MNIFRADFLIVRIECDPTTGGQRQDHCQREYSVLNFQNAAKLGVWARLLKLKQAYSMRMRRIAGGQALVAVGSACEGEFEEDCSGCRRRVGANRLCLVIQSESASREPSGTDGDQ